MVRETLEEHGVVGELVVLADGEDAIQFIQALDTRLDGCPDLAIIDLNLPRASGFDVLSAMRRSMKCNETATVILSSSDVERDRADALRLGASRYLRKPLRLGEFFQLGEIFKAMLEERR